VHILIWNNIKENAYGIESDIRKLPMQVSGW